MKMMISADVIEKYQTILRHNPTSQVFAPLADAYLERALNLQAEELATQGVLRHPLFAGGFLVLGKIQLKIGKLQDAENSLKKTIELSNQNILAYQILGDVYLEQRKPLEALKAYKMVLFLNPHSMKAKQAVEKLETASALEFEEETFAMARLSDLKQVQKNSPPPSETSAPPAHHQEKARKRLLQLVDAFLIRGDGTKAFELLQEIQNEYGEHPDIESRMQKALKKPFKAPLVSADHVPDRSTASAQISREPTAATTAPKKAGLAGRIAREKKLQKLYAMLRSVRMQKMLSSEP